MAKRSKAQVHQRSDDGGHEGVDTPAAPSASKARHITVEFTDAAKSRAQAKLHQAGILQAKIRRAKAKLQPPVAELTAQTDGTVPPNEVARILEIATDSFDDDEKALRWLQEPNLQTGKKPPISIIGTSEGFATVETVLRQIQYGVFG